MDKLQYPVAIIFQTKLDTIDVVSLILEAVSQYEAEGMAQSVGQRLAKDKEWKLVGCSVGEPVYYTRDQIHTIKWDE